jgi:hypothetical protein
MCDGSTCTTHAASTTSGTVVRGFIADLACVSCCLVACCMNVLADYGMSKLEDPTSMGVAMQRNDLGRMS